MISQKLINWSVTNMSLYRFPDSIEPGQYHLTTGSSVPSIWTGTTNDSPMIGHMHLHDSTRNALRAQHNGAIGVSVTVINYTNDPIIYLDRNNNVMTIMPQINRGVDAFGSSIVPDAYAKYQGTIVIEIVQTRNLRDINQQDYRFQQYKKIRELQTNEMSRYHYSDLSEIDHIPRDVSNQVYQYIIPNAQQLINEKQDAFYIEAANIVIMGNNVRELVLHPDTPTSVLLELDKSIPHERSIMQHNLFVVDPECIYSNCYINIGGSVIRLPVRRDARDAPGVYVATNAYDKGIKVKTEIKHYALSDETSPIRLFHTPKDAATYGNPDKLIELEQLKQKLKLSEKAVTQQALQLEMVDKKQQHEMHTLERKETLEEKLHLQKIDQMEKEQKHVNFKQEIDIKRHKREEKASKFGFFSRITFDGIKFATTAIAMVTTALVWFAKRKAT